MQPDVPAGVSGSLAEYALRRMTQPISIAEYCLQLADDLAAYLPSIEQIEAEFQDPT